MFRRRLILTLVIIALAPSAAFAAVPSQVTVQGKVTDAAGNPVTPGPHSFTFRIFNASSGGTQIWPAGGVGDVQIISTDGSGLWAGAIGNNTALTDAVFADTMRWLEINVDGTTLPRTRLVSASTALRVATIDGARGGRLTSGLDFSKASGATLANNLNGIRWMAGTNIQSAFGLVVNNGLWFQSDWDCENCVFGLRMMTADGSLGAPTFAVEYDGDITAKSIQTGEPFGVGVFVGNGNVNASGYVCASIYACPSDSRLKENIATINDPIARIERLRGVTYTRKANPHQSNGEAGEEQVGLIAQEVRDVIPEAVMVQPNGYLAVDYSRLVPLLIEGMKEQQQIIERQNERIANLEKKLEQ